jgi:hypothetical protein
MAVDSYFLLGLLGPAIGFLLVVGAIPVLIYSFRARNMRRGFIASRIALGLSLVSVLVSAILWIELFSGRYRNRNGDPVDYRDGDFAVYEVIAAFEALALLISLLSVMRRSAPRIS